MRIGTRVGTSLWEQEMPNRLFSAAEASRKGAKVMNYACENKEEKKISKSHLEKEIAKVNNKKAFRSIKDSDEVKRSF